MNTIISLRTFTLLACFIAMKQISAQNDSLLYTKGEFKIFKNKAIFKEKTLYDAKKELIELKAHENTKNYGFDYNPLSLVGSYYSYEYSHGGELAGGTPGNSTEVITIDYTTGNSVPLTQLFTEESIVKAIKKDTWVLERTKERTIDLDNITTFNALVDTLNSFNYAKFKPNSFTIFKYDKKKNAVAIRFVGEAYMGFNHHQHLQLGLWLIPKKEFKKKLQTQSYFYLNTFKNWLN